MADPSKGRGHSRVKGFWSDGSPVVPAGGVGEGLGTGLPNDVDYCAIELRVLAYYLNAETDDG